MLYVSWLRKLLVCGVKMFIDTFPKRMHFPTGTWKIVKVAVLCCIVYCLHISFHGSFVHIFCLGLIFSHQQGLRCSLLVRHPGLCVSVLLCQVYSYDLCQRVMSFIHSTTPQYKIYCSTFNPTSYFLATFSILSFFSKSTILVWWTETSVAFFLY